jgi:uncharacterized membrane protein YoaK (UPF0700 family)
MLHRPVLMDATDLLRAPSQHRRQAARRARRQFMPVMAFVPGAIAAGFAYGPLSFWALLLPVVALCLLACLSP